MFNTLKTFFSSPISVTFSKDTTKENSNVFTIGNSDQGFYIANRHGVMIDGTSFYTRRRDAVRGATRRGLTLAA